uniref:FMRFamide receptor n=1 Tax=Lygus hesperus TaxID=30085 RepID=A0A0A9YDG7_LYGHE
MIDQWEYTIHCITAAIGLFGLVGNVISLIVLTRPVMKSPSAILLALVAVFDTIIVLGHNSTRLMSDISSYNDCDLIDNYDSEFLVVIRYQVLPFTIFWANSLVNISLMASMYLTLAMTLERYFAVCHPFKFHEYCTYRRTCIHASAIVTFSILYNLSCFWETEVVKETDGEGNISYDIKFTELNESELYNVLYRTWMHLIFNYLLPLTAIVTLNTAIYLELKKVSRARQALTNSQKNENRLTMMLLCVVVEFIVCTSVNGFFALWNTLRPSDFYIFELDVNVDINILLQPVSDFFTTFNSSVNFVTYVTFRGPFRRTLVDMFRCHKKNVKHLRSGDPEEQSGSNSKDTPT